MTHGSLFSGIGGFDLAAEWCGWENVFHCEMGDFGQRVLKYYWPRAISYADITKTDFTIHRGAIDVLSGGFPCQPYSQAGKRKGKEDDRHLWPEMLRAIREIRPRYVVGENVRGLTNWNGGMVFDEVQADLEAEGYEVLPFLLPACAVNAPHRRDRIWFVAKNAHQNGRGGEQRKEKSKLGELRNVGSGDNEWLPADNAKIGAASYSDSDGQLGSHSEYEVYPSQRGLDALGYPEQGLGDGHASDTSECGLQANHTVRKSEGEINAIGEIGNKQSARFFQPDWHEFPTEPPLHGRDDGIPKKLAIFVVNEVRHEISKTSKENRIENLQEVWERVQQEEVWEQVRRLYSLESKDLLFQTMQLYSTGAEYQGELSPFSEKVSEKPLRTLRKYGEFTSSPQGQKLQKQRTNEFGNTLWFLPHEVALAARAYTNSIREFEAWHRNESIKAYGNAIVPQVAYEIFKAINKYEEI